MSGALWAPTLHPDFSFSNFICNCLFTALSHHCESSLAPFTPPQLLFVVGYIVSILIFLMLYKLVPKILELECHG